MVTPQPQPSPSPPQRQQDLSQSFQSFKHYAALGFLLGAPVLIALPPRKLDINTFALGSSVVLSAGHLLRERRSRMRMESPFGAGGVGVVEQQEEDVRGRRKVGDGGEGLLDNIPSPPNWDGGMRKGKAGLREELEKRSDWKEQRLEEEQEKLENGEGYGGMILDQIWEVWNWGKEKGEALETEKKDVLVRQEREDSGST